MTQVCLSGNTFYDTVCIMDKFPIENQSNQVKKIFSSLGGVWNLKRIFDYCGINSHCSTTVGTDDIGYKIKSINYLFHDIQEKSGQTSQSIIFSDLSKNKRTSVVYKGVGNEHITADPWYSDWHHITYLDTLDNWTSEIMQKIKFTSKVLTVDLCQPNHDLNRYRIFECLKHVDGIIASDVELYSLFQTNIDDFCLNLALDHVKFCILHTPDYVLYKDREGQSINMGVTKTEKQINVLGAGDTFAAHVIINRLNNLDWEYSISDSIIKTKSFLETNI